MRSHRPFSQALRLPKPPPTVAGLYTQKEFEAKRAYNVDKLQVKSRTHPLPLSRMHVCTGGRAWGFCFHTGRLPLPPPRMPAVLACAWAVRLCAQHRPAGGRLPALELAAGGALAGRAGLVGRAGAERGLGAHPGALGRGQSCLVDLSLQPNCLLGGQLVCDTTWRPMCSLGTCLGPAMSLAGPAPRQLSANRLLRMHALQAGVTLLLGLPWSWYSTFVLEARHGFNKTSLRTFVADTAKSVGGRQELGQVCAASIVTRVQAGRGAGEGGPCGGCGVTSTSHVPCATERRRCSCWRTRLAPVRRCRRAGPPPPVAAHRRSCWACCCCRQWWLASPPSCSAPAPGWACRCAPLPAARPPLVSAGVGDGMQGRDCPAAPTEVGPPAFAQGRCGMASHAHGPAAC